MFDGLFTTHSVEKVRKPLRKLMGLSGAKRDYDVGIQILEASGVKPQSSVMLKFREKRDRELKTFAHYLGRKKIRNEAGRWRKRLRAEGQPSGDWELVRREFRKRAADAAAVGGEILSRRAISALDARSDRVKYCIIFVCTRSSCVTRSKSFSRYTARS